MLFGVVAAICGLGAVAAAAAKPHIVFMLVDDWGWGNVGWHRPGFNETVTPNLDSLVASGVQLTSQYVRARAPERPAPNGRSL